jgi:hypothetical protein
MPLQERSIDDAGRDAWESVREGYVDEAWKDTVLVMLGERDRILRRFTGFLRPLRKPLSHPRTRGHGHDAQHPY